MNYRALVLSLALVGCNGVNVSQGALTTAEKSLTIAHLAYNGAGTALKSAADSGVLKGQNAAQAKVYFDKAGDALALADKADTAANAQGILAQITIAEDLLAQASALTKK
jgi:uncharacterized lipoprotein NlpE involved in copper resistance